jgi:hypothetical protein
MRRRVYGRRIFSLATLTWRKTEAHVSSAISRILLAHYLRDFLAIFRSDRRAELTLHCSNTHAFVAAGIPSIDDTNSAGAPTRLAQRRA